MNINHNGQYYCTTIKGDIVTNQTVKDTHGTSCTYYYVNGKMVNRDILKNLRSIECFPHEFVPSNGIFTCKICKRTSSSTTEWARSHYELNPKPFNPWERAAPHVPTINPIYNQKV